MSEHTTHRWTEGNRLTLTLLGTIVPAAGSLVSVYLVEDQDYQGWLVRARITGPQSRPGWSHAMVSELQVPDGEAAAWRVAESLADEAAAFWPGPPVDPPSPSGVLS